MATFNGTSKSNSLSDPIDSLESNFKSVVDYLMSTPRRRTRRPR